MTYNISTAPPTVNARAATLPAELKQAVHDSYDDFLKSKPEPARVVGGLPSKEEAAKLLGQLRRYALSLEVPLGIYAPATSAVKEEKGGKTFSLTFETRNKRKLTPSTEAPAAPDLSETGPVPA